MKISDLVEKYHWLEIDDDGVLCMFLDHHMLSMFRQCEASFELQMMANVRAKSRSWNLEFGICWHRLVEKFYVDSKAEVFDFKQWLEFAVEYWHKRQMDEFSEHKMYKTLGGLPGFLAMCGQYVQHFAAEVDRLRVVGIEIGFGKKKEVLLGEFNVTDINPSMQPHYKIEFDIEIKKVRCYLTGRIDFLMDSGNAIGPLDHKSTAFFKNNPANSYDPQEGMTGYIFATRAILKQSFPELLANRKVDRIWMNFAQITPTSNALERFKRVPLFKTDWQLEEYRLRQLRTFNKIYDMLILGQRPDWNTSVCNNMFHNECQFRNLHRQNTAQNMLNILNADFVVAEPWNPELLKED